MCFISVDTKIQCKLPLSLRDFISINKEGIRIHEKFLKLTGDDHSVTGTHEYHQEYIDFYNQAILFTEGKSSMTKAEIIAKYQDDADNHLRIINEGHTSEAEGDAAHQAKWFHRWEACALFVSNIML